MAIKKWFLPTNTANLGMMIAQGLISAPIGCSKYYSDILSEQLGYIPLFYEKEQLQLISAALTKAISESNSLIPCIIEINLNHILSGNVYTDTGDSVDLSKLTLDEFNVNRLFILAPLPLSCIARILFNNGDGSKDEFIKNTKILYRNVPLSSIKIEAPKNMAKFFNSNTNAIFDNDQNNKVELPKVTTVEYKKTYALGGILCALFYFSKNGGLSNRMFIEACNLSKTDKKDIYDFSLIYNYFYSPEASQKDKDSTNKLLIAILDIIAGTNAEDSNELIIELLQSESLSEEGGFRERAKKLADELIEFHRNIIDIPISETFKISKTAKEKSSIKLLLLMLFHRKDVGALIDFQLEVFEEEDYILFAILFGLRDTFIKVPKFLKEYDGLQFYISNLMAKYAHDTAQTGITFKPIKSPPTLIDMLKPSKLEFISWASKELDIQDCFNSVMPSKNFKNHKGSSTYSGIVIPKIERDELNFFKKMSAIKIDNCLYNKVSQKYKKL